MPEFFTHDRCVLMPLSATLAVERCHCGDGPPELVLIDRSNPKAAEVVSVPEDAVTSLARFLEVVWPGQDILGSTEWNLRWIGDDRTVRRAI